MGAVFLAPGFGRPRSAVSELASVFLRPRACVEECSHSSPSQSLSEFGCTQKAMVKKSRLMGERGKKQEQNRCWPAVCGRFLLSFKASAKDWFPRHRQEGT